MAIVNLFWIKCITERITKVKGFSDRGTSSPPICHPTHPYIRKPLAL
jgi:hypothetical protein